MSMSIYGERELDVRVAEALQWKWISLPLVGVERRRLIVETPEEWIPCDPADESLPLFGDWQRDLPRFSSSPAAYMGLLHTMEGRGAGAWSLGVVNAEHKYACEINRCFGYGDTEGEAICRAALAVFGRDK